MELEPGYIVREPMPFGRRVSYDGLFEGLADPLIGVLSGSDGGLAGLAGRVGEDGPVDLPAAYIRTIGAAGELHDGEVAAGSQSSAGALLANGGNVDALHGAVARYLPSPDAPFDTTFVDPPDGAVIHTGRGFDTAPAAAPPSREPPGPDPDPHTPRETVVRNQVRNLYLELLGREPDPGGWDTWSARVLEDGWTIADVRNAILGSDEYHDKHPS